MGDCREILPTLSGVDCTVTSPPYNQMEGIANRAPSGLWADKSIGLGFVNSWKEKGYTVEENVLLELANTPVCEAIP